VHWPTSFKVIGESAPVSPASAVSLHQAVDFHIIGCGIPNTEIELLLAMVEVGGIPLFPTARLHVDAAVDVALESRPTPGLSVRDRCQG
jgi:aspartate/glutamate racemase